LNFKELTPHLKQWQLRAYSNVGESNSNYNSNYAYGVSAHNVELDTVNLVTVDDNDRLLEPIQDSKIKDVFQMDKFKALGLDDFKLNH